MLCSVFCLAPHVPHLPLETRGLAWYVRLIAMTEAQESEWELQGFLRLRLGVDTVTSDSFYCPKQLTWPHSGAGNGIPPTVREHRKGKRESGDEDNDHEMEKSKGILEPFKGRINRIIANGLDVKSKEKDKT